MKKRNILTIAAIVLLGVESWAQLPEALKVKEFTLENGLTVWINEDHSLPTAYGAVVVKAGAKDCPGTGIAHYFEHMMFKGTDKFGTISYELEKPYLDSIAAMYDSLARVDTDEQRLAVQMEINRLSIEASRYAIPNEYDKLAVYTGASMVNAYTGYDQTVYYTNFIPAYAEQWASLAADRLVNPVFRLFQSELETVYEEKNMYADNAMSSFYEKAMTMFFEGTDYAQPVIGTTQNLKNPRLSEMMEFYDKYYVASNMGLVITGDVYPEQILPVIERHFGTIRKGQEPQHAPQNPAPLQGVRQETINAKLPPLINVSLLMFRAPEAGHEDNMKLELLCNMFNNSENTGYFDLLASNNKIMGAQLMSDSMNQVGMLAMLAIPLPLVQKNAKAEKLIMEQIEKVKKGDFSADFLEKTKLSLKKSYILALEDLDNRMNHMASLFSEGRTWDDFLADVQSIDSITAEDIVAVANKYFGPDYILVRKANGEVESDNLRKPPYDKVVPQSRDSVSAYAAAFIQSAEGLVPEVRGIDFDRDVKTVALSDNVKIIASENTLNDVFSLIFKFKTGTNEHPELDRIAEYLPRLGTSDMKAGEFYSALQSLGASVSFSAGPQFFAVTVGGYDASFDATMDLACRVFTDLKKDKKIVKAMKSEEASGKAMLKEDVSSVSKALFQKLLYADKSEYLVDPGKWDAALFMNSFSTVQKSECDIVYCGNTPLEAVEAAIRRNFAVEAVDTPARFVENSVSLPDSAAVYFINIPGASQSNIYAVRDFGHHSDLRTRALGTFYSSYYLGGGMTSYLFQEIREFRSMAYSTGSSSVRSSFRNASAIPAVLLGFVGTQCDKTTDAMAVMDSLIVNTPMNPVKFEVARMDYLNAVAQGYPTAREMGVEISALRDGGFAEDPSPYYASVLESLTLEQFEAFYKEMLGEKNMTWCVVGDASKIDMEALAAFGPIVTLSVNDVIRN